MADPKPVVLCILDGWGKRAEQAGNAPALANTPNFDRVMQTCPAAELITHGADAGLPKGQMGNSEVGHTNIGAGRVVAMDLGQIDLAIENGSYAVNDEIKAFINTLKTTGGRAHVLGVASDGGVHGQLTHMIETIEIFAAAGVPVVVHALTDGRDVAPQSAERYIDQLVRSLPESATVGTVTGRYYAMDRDNRWERVEAAFNAMVKGAGRRADTPLDAIALAYSEGAFDEFIPATVIDGYAGIKPEDGIFMLNFRADRARQILRAFADPDFTEFDRGPKPELAAWLGMVDYSEEHNGWYKSVFPKRDIPNTLGAWVAQKGKRQFRLAETEKYPHVTFFLNGGKEEPEPGEDRFMPSSPKVATYDLAPEMAAAEVTEAFVGAIEDGYDLIVTNYANPDMVGHTGDIDAAIKACEAVDRGLGKVLAALEAAGGAMIITADHGNCETMIDPETGKPHTAHTTNPVPVALVGGPEGAVLRNGRLCDLAPTVLQLMGLEQPEDMTGVSLLS